MTPLESTEARVTRLAKAAGLYDAIEDVPGMECWRAVGVFASMVAEECATLAHNAALHCEDHDNPYGQGAALDVEDAIRAKFPPPTTDSVSLTTDRTGLCTVRDFAQAIHEGGVTASEMWFDHLGKRWNVELHVTRVADLQDPLAVDTDVPPTTEPKP